MFTAIVVPVYATGSTQHNHVNGKVSRPTAMRRMLHKANSKGLYNISGLYNIAFVFYFLTNESISYFKLITFDELLPIQCKKQFIWIHFIFLCKVINIKWKKETLYFVLTCLCLILWLGLRISQKNPPAEQHNSFLHYWTAVCSLHHQSNWTTWNPFKRKY